MIRKSYWLVVMLVGWLLIVGCSAETAEPTAIPPTDVPATAIPPTDPPPTATTAPTEVVEVAEAATEAPTAIAEAVVEAATEAPTVAAATEAPVVEEPVEEEPEGIMLNGYIDVIYTQDNYDLLSTGERLKFVQVYATW